MIANWATGSVNYKREPLTGPSLTIPGQTRTLSEIVERFIRGDSTEVFKGTFSETFPPGFENLTELERLEMSRDIDAGVADIRERVRNRKHIKMTDAQKAEIAEKNKLPVKGDSTEGSSDATLPGTSKP